jgi:hypothetical protein
MFEVLNGNRPIRHPAAALSGAAAMKAIVKKPMPRGEL